MIATHCSEFSSPYDSVPEWAIPLGNRLPEDEHFSQAGPDLISVLLAQGVLAVASLRALVPELVLTGQDVLVPQRQCPLEKHLRRPL